MKRPDAPVRSGARQPLDGRPTSRGSALTISLMTCPTAAHGRSPPIESWAFGLVSSIDWRQPVPLDERLEPEW